MPWILVAESESRFAERIRDGLAADGWQVEIVDSAEAADALASERPPDLLLASVELAGAAALLERHSRRRGGSGSVALLPEIGGGEEVARAADERISKPFTDQDLRLVVRRFAATGHAPRKPPPAAADEPRMTSKDLFGDVLAEMAEELEPGRKPAAPAAHRPPQPGAPKPAARDAGQSEMDKALEQTLSGLLDQGKKSARPRTRKMETEVDDLISRTLSGLGAEPRPPKPAPPAPKPPAASDTPALDRLFEPPPPGAGERKRGSREIDLSSLDALARPATPPPAPPADAPASDPASAKPPQPGVFATQKVSIPASLRGRSASTEFGQYTLLERIAVGGMAEVWKARMKGVEGFQKTVAIKKILAHLTDSSDFVTMFIDEAKLAAQLNHTNIIHIYDLGKIDDDYYIAMEYVDGRDLRTILNTSREKNQPLPLGIALLVASRLASALNHAHRMKDFEGRPLEIVHRDVSPQNVLISFEGEVKLCDFGIVKAVTKASKTQMGALKGKLQYMSPEQAWGRPVDARSDIFSLGSLLFEMLTGRRLFAGDSEMSVLDAVREGRIQAPRDLDPRLPLEVNALVLRALEKEPKNRFQSAGEMQKQIESILATLKPSPTQHELAEHMKKLYGAGAAPAPAIPGLAAAAPLPEPAPEPAPPPAKRAAAEVPAVERVAAETARPVTHGGDKALETPATGGRSFLWIGLAALVVLSLVGYFLFSRGRQTAPEPAPEGAPAAESAPAEPETTGGGEPEAIDEAGTPSEEGSGAADRAPTEAGAEPAPIDVASVVDEEVKKREEELRRQYQAELERKRRALDAAQAAAEEEPEDAPPPAETEAAPPGAPPTAPSDPEQAPAKAEPAPARLEPAPVRTRPEPTPPPPPPPPAPKAKEGDLVQPGAGVRPPVLVSIDRPQYPPMARRLKVEGTVVMSLLVDEKGQVLDVRLESGVQQNVGINEAALEAARSAKFRPATKDGVRVKMWYRLNVPFKL